MEIGQTSSINSKNTILIGDKSVKIIVRTKGKNQEENNREILDRGSDGDTKAIYQYNFNQPRILKKIFLREFDGDNNGQNFIKISTPTPEILNNSANLIKNSPLPHAISKTLAYSSDSRSIEYQSF